MKINIPEIQELYLKTQDQSLPARTIFQAEYDLMKKMPEIISFIIYADGVLRGLNEGKVERSTPL
jgi:hypothetical protein